MSQNLRLSAIILTGALTMSANATQLISNGDFQNPLIAPWITYGASSIISEWPGLSDLSLPGNRFALMGGFGYEAEGVSQFVDFGAVAGPAVLAFDYQYASNDLPGRALFDITIGSSLVQRFDLGEGGYQGFSSLTRRTYDVGAYMGTGVQEVKFFLRKDVGTQSRAMIDNVSLVARPVPEPATLTALGCGLLAMLRRRKSS